MKSSSGIRESLRMIRNNQRKEVYKLLKKLLPVHLEYICNAILSNGHERQIVKTVKSKILAKFSNIESISDFWVRRMLKTEMRYSFKKLNKLPKNLKTTGK